MQLELFDRKKETLTLNLIQLKKDMQRLNRELDRKERYARQTTNVKGRDRLPKHGMSDIQHSFDGDTE